MPTIPANHNNTSLTTNRNFLAPTSFKLTIVNDTYANFEYFITNISMPTIQCDEIVQNYQGSKLFMPGGPIDSGVLTVKYMIDENMKNYEELFNWLMQNNKMNTPVRHDMILTIMTSKNNLNRQFRFIGSFPTSVSGFELSTQSTDVEYVSSDVSFRYNRLEIIR